MSVVSQVTPASADQVMAHFGARLALETDCDDVASVLRKGEPEFVLLHVVGTPDAYAHRHVPGAVHLPHWDMTAESLARWPKDTLFVVYCAGPHCNGADKAAFKLGQLGRKVKLMIGGITGWADEGLPFCHGPQPGRMP